MELGYQNVRTAKALARFVVRTVEKKYGKGVKVIICGIDGSSTYLATFCKILRQEWMFCSGSKDSGRMNYCNPFNYEDEVIHIFVDDCLYVGNTSRTMDKILFNYSRKHIDEFFYICGNKHRLEIQNASTNFLDERL